MNHLSPSASSPYTSIVDTCTCERTGTRRLHSAITCAPRALLRMNDDGPRIARSLCDSAAKFTT